MICGVHQSKQCPRLQHHGARVCVLHELLEYFWLKFTHNNCGLPSKVVLLNVPVRGLVAVLLFLFLVNRVSISV